MKKFEFENDHQTKFPLSKKQLMKNQMLFFGLDTYKYTNRKNTDDFKNCIPIRKDKLNNLDKNGESEACKKHRAELKNMKQKFVKTINDKVIVTYRHPKLKELSFCKKDPVIKEHPTEEIPKELRLENIPYDKSHYDLIKKLNNDRTQIRINQTTIKENHEIAITKMIEKLKNIRKDIKMRYLKLNNKYYVCINKFYDLTYSNELHLWTVSNHDKLYYPITTYYSNANIDILKNVIKNIHMKLKDSMKNYCSIFIYNSSNDNQIVGYLAE